MSACRAVPRYLVMMLCWVVAESVSSSMNRRYADLLGTNSGWQWLLRNQQQYEDGFQIELGPSTTFQYLAMASRLYLRQVTEAA